MFQVTIVGAGIVGLTLGQALKAQDIPFTILERDASADHRQQGWAITLHWALQHLQQMLPAEVLHQIEACHVDPEVAKNDSRDFLFLNLEDGSVKCNIPQDKRWRLNRGKMRLALLEGIADRVRWNKEVVQVDYAVEGTKAARIMCSDGSSYDADLVVGADGSNSQVRKILCPDNHAASQMSYRLVGVHVNLTQEQMAPLRSIDPLLFQGCHPRTGTFMWFSVLRSPTEQDPTYTVQINLSWAVKSPEDEVPAGDTARLADMKARARGFASRLRDVIEAIPRDTPVVEARLTNWGCPDWDNHGCMTLAGDAAHSMTMYRGEAANYGLLDAFHLLAALRNIRDGNDQHIALDRYEKALRRRAQRAVVQSRQACVDAHEWERLTKDSPVLTKREMPAV